MDLLGDGSLQAPSKSLLKPGLHIGEAFATPCALLSSSSIADIQVNSLISHLSILLMLLMLMLLMLSTKDRIRSGPQPISHLMSNSNRCCHQGCSNPKARPSALTFALCIARRFLRCFLPTR